MSIWIAMYTILQIPHDRMYVVMLFNWLQMLKIQILNRFENVSLQFFKIYYSFEINPKQNISMDISIYRKKAMSGNCLQVALFIIFWMYILFSYISFLQWGVKCLAVYSECVGLCLSVGLAVSLSHTHMRVCAHTHTALLYLIVSKHFLLYPAACRTSYWIIYTIKHVSIIRLRIVWSDIKLQ